MDTEFNDHISCPASCLRKLRKRVWKNRKLRSETEMVVDNACELSMLLHGSDKWSIYAKQIIIDQRVLRRILEVSWRDRVSNAEVLRRCGCDNMHTILTTRSCCSGSLDMYPDCRMTGYPRYLSGRKLNHAGNRRQVHLRSEWPVIIRFQDFRANVWSLCASTEVTISRDINLTVSSFNTLRGQFT